MQSLYSNGFETIYDEMYQTFIDYNDEYDFYNAILKQYKKNKILEIGCGSGNLAKHFIKNKYNYSGFDYSSDMVRLCKSKNPKRTFILGDMRNFSLKSKQESILITGRTSSYLLSNKDICDALQSIHANTSENFMFDWQAEYYEVNEKESKLIAKDASEVRAFTKNEWEIFLCLNNFELVEFIDRKSYAFDTYFIVAKKC
jgi:SAM-dependent methyltransferase